MEELKENLFSWYSFKDGAEILDLGNNISNYIKNNGLKIDTQPVQSKKYDYVLMVGMLAVAKEFIDSENPRVDLLNKAKSYLKENGKILIAEDNKFGIKNWNGKRDLDGSLDYREITRTYNPNENGLLAKHQIKELLNQAGILRNKFYYLFPDFNIPNMIFTDDYTLTEEDITRNFEAYEEGELVNFNENLALIEIVKESPEQAKFFVNSFLIEASNTEIETDINYVSFTNYRKKEYRIATIIKKDSVQKKAAISNAQKHIDNISENIKLFPSQNSEVLDIRVENYLESKFIKDVKRLDLYLKDINNYNNFVQEFKKYQEIVYQDVVKYSEIDKEKMSDKIKNYDEEKLSKMHFLKNAFIDMLPKNCFVIDGKYCFFDQEWMEENYPAEYIIYRAILNTAGVIEKYGEEKIFKELGIYEYIDLFKSLEEDFRNKVIDEKMLYGLFEQKVTTREAMIADFTRKIIDRDVEIEKLHVDIEGRKAHVEQLLNVIQEKENQIINISNSLSWRITKPLRDVSGKLHEMKNKKNK